MKATRKSIAAAAGVSPSTVGMILSGLGENYNEDTRARVLRTAAEMGYQPSINARAMRLKRSLLLGVLLHEVNTHLAASFLHGVQEAIEDTDYSPLVFFAKSETAQLRNLTRCRQRLVDGLLVNCVIDPATGAAEAVAGELKQSKIPAVEIFGNFLPGVPKVDMDNRQSGFLAARHLIELGHRRITLLTHSRYERSDAHFDAWEHACGYRDALLAAGLEPRIVPVELDYTHVTEASFLQAGFDAFQLLTARPDSPTAVLCYADQLAYGLNRACRARGVDVPGQLSICGNNGLTLSTLANPPLTTTKTAYFEVGRTAVSNLLQVLAGETPADILIPPAMELRQSTGHPPATSPVFTAVG